MIRSIQHGRVATETEARSSNVLSKSDARLIFWLWLVLSVNPKCFLISCFTVSLSIYIYTKSRGLSDQAKAWLQPWELDFKSEPPEFIFGSSCFWHLKLWTEQHLQQAQKDLPDFNFKGDGWRHLLNLKWMHQSFNLCQVCLRPVYLHFWPCQQRRAIDALRWTATESWLFRWWKISENSSGWRNKIHREKVKWC